MLRILACVVFSLCLVTDGLNAAAVPSVTPAHQQEPNPAPVPDHQLRFPAGRTKNSDPEAPQYDAATTSDYSVCFPYFISQDIESLLAQAIRMLDRVADARQRGWLLVFVQKLDSLSRQLRSLPVKHRNMCFQQNRQNLDDISSEEEEEYDDEVAEGDVTQLYNAKNLFESAAGHDRSDHGPYVMGTVFDREHPEHQSTKRFHVKGHRPDAVTEPVHDPHGLDVQEPLDGQPGNPLDPSSIQFASHIIGSDRNDDAVSPLDREMVPAGNWPPSSMTYENMPFLPRSTRKGIPQLLVDKLRYHPHLGRNHQIQTTDSHKPSTESTATEISSPTVKPVGPDGDDIPTTGRTASGDQHQVTENIHGQVQNSVQNGNQMDRPLAGTDRYELPRVMAATDEKHSQPSQAQPDDAVKQLHSNADSGGKSNIDDKRLGESSIFIDSQAAPANSEEIVKSPPQYEQHSSEEQIHQNQKIYGKYDDYKHSPYDNNLDFEYDDQGAGELYAEDDAGAEKLLAIPPPKLLPVGDEVVRQLHELRSSITDGQRHLPDSTGNNQMQTSQAYPTEITKADKKEE